MPRVSVLMTVYNRKEFLAECIESMLCQSLRDFEFIIVDGGSTDGARQILSDFARRDARIRVIDQSNQGQAAGRNLALAHAKAELVAIMDSDDISQPERLKRQVDFILSHPRIGVCGTWLQTIGADNAVWRYPLYDAAIRSHLIFSPALANPAVLAWTNILAAVGGYDTTWRAAEDYELWTRLASRTAFANIPEVLLFHRIHARQLSEEQQSGPLQAAMKAIHLALLARLDMEPEPREIEMHEALSVWRIEPSRSFVSGAEAWLDKLLSVNQKASLFPKHAFARILADRWWEACWRARSLGLWTWQQWITSSLRQSTSVPGSMFARFTFACLRHQFS